MSLRAQFSLLPDSLFELLLVLISHTCCWWICRVTARRENCCFVYSACACAHVPRAYVSLGAWCADLNPSVVRLSLSIVRNSLIFVGHTLRLYVWIVERNSHVELHAVERWRRDFITKGSLPSTSRHVKESTASGCCDDEAPRLPSARPVPDAIADVVDAEFGWCRTLSSDVVVDKVAVTLSWLFDPTSRAAKSTVVRCCRRVVNRLPRSALRYASRCIARRCVSVILFSCRCLFSFSSPNLQFICTYELYGTVDLLLFC